MKLMGTKQDLIKRWRDSASALIDSANKIESKTSKRAEIMRSKAFVYEFCATDLDILEDTAALEVLKKALEYVAFDIEKKGNNSRDATDLLNEIRNIIARAEGREI